MGATNEKGIWVRQRGTWMIDVVHRMDMQETLKKKNIDKNSRATALVHHVSKTKHEFNFGEKRILKKVRHKGILKINETNQIVLHEGYAVNFKKDAEHVTPMFYNLLKHSERIKSLQTSAKCKPRSTSTPTPKYRY